MGKMMTSFTRDSFVTREKQFHSLRKRTKMSKLTSAEYAEELAKVDQELKLLQKELEDTLQLNDNFQKNIQQKVSRLWLPCLCVDRF
jgi:predicted  nucleic acid-binding Zn-ribbon protein